MHTHILILVHTSTVSAASTEISAFSFTDTSTAFYFSTDNSTSTLAEISIAKIDYSETVISQCDSTETFEVSVTVQLLSVLLSVFTCLNTHSQFHCLQGSNLRLKSLTAIALQLISTSFSS